MYIIKYNKEMEKQKQISQSKPIDIPKTNASTQYSLKQNCFNPNKASPPTSSWNNRLMQRITNTNKIVPISSL
jgi:hypothetical protein